MALFTTSGPYAGLPVPKIQAGKVRLPPHCTYNTSTLTVTANRYYAVPFPIAEATTFAGVKFYNSGTGDSGSKVKIAAYFQGAAGGLGTLAKNFGEATLGSAAAINTLVSSWAASPGMYFLVLAANAGVALGTMESMPRSTTVGYVTANVLAMMNSFFPSDVMGSANSGAYIGDYVGGTYANFPEAAGLTLTNSLAGIVSVGGTGIFPLFGLCE